jgi:enoyl-CoA hydratase
MSDSPLSVSIDDRGVAVVHLDDGKANALSHTMIDLLHAALDRAEADARAVCFIGREGKFCAGFDLSVMTAGPDATRGLVKAGGELLMRLYGHPQPTVVAVTGHALAAGALFILACDTRIAADVGAKIGLNETAIGMGLPRYGVELARDRLSKRAFIASVLQADIHDPIGALESGYVDRVVPVDECIPAAVDEAARLGEFRIGAYSLTKNQMRSAMIADVRRDLDADMLNMVPPTV